MKFVFMGIFNTVIPSLITWGETQIDSSLASILNRDAAVCDHHRALLAARREDYQRGWAVY